MDRNDNISSERLCLWTLSVVLCLWKVREADIYNVELSIKEHNYNLTQDLLEKWKSARRAYREGRKMCWKEAKVSQIDRSTPYRKNKGSAHMCLVHQAISHPSLGISPIRTPIIVVEARNVPLRPVQKSCLRTFGVYTKNMNDYTAWPINSACT
jgi:hypothetical protein